MEAAAGALLQEKAHKMDNMPTLGAEDFAFFFQAMPGSFFSLAMVSIPNICTTKNTIFETRI
ncbi:hypothetical protein TASI_0990 [Taylorella asinigenitalis MCE3]|uniref:Uncharacterized protein n=1 Tax=Taylorella asinigenitalis (strain MCE3) TaxID=1008459 RepID=G4QBD0_TAYAM|nr:hypothetical protein TASI_0990 [Taylorella asinigenitalis MCE3]